MDPKDPPKKNWWQQGRYCSFWIDSHCKVHVLTSRIWYSKSSRIFSSIQKKKILQKIDFFKNEAKNKKNRNGVTSENVSSLSKKHLVVV